MKYKIILFDLDGTITDSKTGIFESLQYALNKLGVPEKKTHEFISWIGLPLQDSFKRVYGFNDDEITKAVEYYREYYSKKGIFENRLYDGMKELLQELFDSQKMLYVASSKPVQFSEQIIKHFGLEKYFKQIIGPQSDLKKLSKADMIAKVIRQYPGKDTKTFIMIGDRKYDISGANEAGIDSIGVLFGYGKTEEIEKARPTYIVNSVKELGTLLNK